LCAKDGCLVKAVIEQSWFNDVLIPSLIAAVKEAPTNAGNAYIASCGLNSLLCSDVAKQIIQEGDTVEALKKAHECGLERHDLLATESRHCLDALSR
jgi:hypothetical protein